MKSRIPESSTLEMPLCASDLRRRIEERTAVVGVLGLGYVGLPLALAFAEQSFRVIGIRRRRRQGRRARAGRIVHPAPRAGTPGRVRWPRPGSRRPATSGASRSPTSSHLRAHAPDAPAGAGHELRRRHGAGDRAAAAPRASSSFSSRRPIRGRPTSWSAGSSSDPGSTCGRDFFLAFSPEREDPGNPHFGTATIPKVVGGVDPVSGDLAQALYDKAIARTVRVSDARTAEATKLVENIFRAVNIALVNELKMVFDRMGIDVWEVLDAAATKPFGFMRFDPGPRLGRALHPARPVLSGLEGARVRRHSPKFIELAGDVNVQMPHYVIEKLQLALNEPGPVRSRGAESSSLVSHTRKTSTTRARAPHSRSSTLLLGLGASVSLPRPSRTPGAADARLAGSASHDFAAADGGGPRGPGCRRDRDRPLGGRL